MLLDMTRPEMTPFCGNSRPDAARPSTDGLLKNSEKFPFCHKFERNKLPTTKYEGKNRANATMYSPYKWTRRWRPVNDPIQLSKILHRSATPGLNSDTLPSDTYNYRTQFGRSSLHPPQLRDSTRLWMKLWDSARNALFLGETRVAKSEPVEAEVKV